MSNVSESAAPTRPGMYRLRMHRIAVAALILAVAPLAGATPTSATADKRIQAAAADVRVVNPAGELSCADDTSRETGYYFDLENRGSKWRRVNYRYTVNGKTLYRSWSFVAPGSTKRYGWGTIRPGDVVWLTYRSQRQTILRVQLHPRCPA